MGGAFGPSRIVVRPTAAAPGLLAAINAEVGGGDPDDRYALLLSDRLGHSSSKEQYGYYYRVGSLSPVDSFHFNDKDPRWARVGSALAISCPLLTPVVGMRVRVLVLRMRGCDLPAADGGFSDGVSVLIPIAGMPARFHAV